MKMVAASSLFVHFYSTVMIGDEVSISFNPPLPPVPHSRLHLVNGTCPLGHVQATIRLLERERRVTLLPGNTSGPLYDQRASEHFPRPPRELFVPTLSSVAPLVAS